MDFFNIFLRTTPKYFSNWLVKHTEALTTWECSYQGNTLYLQPIIYKERETSIEGHINGVLLVPQKSSKTIRIQMNSIIEVNIFQLMERKIEVAGKCKTQEDSVLQIFEFLYNEIIERWPNAEVGNQPVKRGRKERTNLAAKLFKKIKDDNPTLSYSGVASKATDYEINRISQEIKRRHTELNYTEIQKEATTRFQTQWNRVRFTRHQVIYAYKINKWEFKRSNSI